MKKMASGKSLRLAAVAAAAVSAQLFWPAPISAEERSTDTLQAVLDQIPAAALVTGGPAPVQVVDMAAIASLGQGLIGNDMAQRLQLSAFLPPLNALLTGGADEFAQKSGAALADIRSFASIGTAPDQSVMWVMKDAQTVEGLIATLRQRDFQEIGDGLLANGDPQSMDFEKRDPMNPWRGMTGQASIVAPHGDALIQTSSAEQAKTLQSTSVETSLGQTPMTEIALTGLASRLEGGTLLQAIAVIPDLNQPPAALEAFLREKGDLTDLQHQLEAGIAPSSAGLPVFFLGLIADIQRPEGPALVVSLAYPDCSAAQKGVDQMRKSWAEQVTPEDSTVLTGSAVTTAQGCAAVFEAANNGGNAMDNPAFRFVLSAMMKRDLALLRIGH